MTKKNIVTVVIISIVFTLMLFATPIFVGLYNRGVVIEKVSTDVLLQDIHQNLSNMQFWGSNMNFPEGSNPDNPFQPVQWSFITTDSMEFNEETIKLCMVSGDESKPSYLISTSGVNATSIAFEFSPLFLEDNNYICYIKFDTPDSKKGYFHAKQLFNIDGNEINRFPSFDIAEKIMDDNVLFESTNLVNTNLVVEPPDRIQLRGWSLIEDIDGTDSQGIVRITHNGETQEFLFDLFDREDVVNFFSDTRYLNSGMNTFIPGYDGVGINDLEITLGVKHEDKYYLSNQTYLFTDGVPTLYKRIEKIVDDSVVFEYSDLVKTDLFIPPDTRLLRGWSFIEGVDSTDSQGIIRIMHNGETQEFLFDFSDREDVVNFFSDTRYLNSGMNTFISGYDGVDINDLEITLGVKHEDKYYLSNQTYLFINGVPTLSYPTKKIIDDSVVFEYSDLVKTDLFIPPDTRLLKGWSFIEGVDSTDSQGIIRIMHNGETQEFLFDFSERQDVVNFFRDTRYLNSGMNTFIPSYDEVDINDLEITLGVKREDKYYLSNQTYLFTNGVLTLYNRIEKIVDDSVVFVDDSVVFEYTDLVNTNLVVEPSDRIQLRGWSFIEGVDGTDSQGIVRITHNGETQEFLFDLFDREDVVNLFSDMRYLNSGMNTFISGYDGVDINDLEITLGVKREDKYYLSNQTYLFTNGVPTLYNRVDDSVVFEYSDLVKTDLFIPPDTRLLKGWSFIEGVDSTDSQGIIRIMHNGETQEFLFDFSDREDVVNLFSDTRYLNSGMNTFIPGYDDVDINDLEITLGVKHEDKYYLSNQTYLFTDGVPTLYKRIDDSVVFEYTDLVNTNLVVEPLARIQLRGWSFIEGVDGTDSQGIVRIMHNGETQEFLFDLFDREDVVNFFSDTRYLNSGMNTFIFGYDGVDINDLEITLGVKRDDKYYLSNQTYRFTDGVPTLSYPTEKIIDDSVVIEYTNLVNTNLVVEPLARIQLRGWSFIEGVDGTDSQGIVRITYNGEAQEFLFDLFDREDVVNLFSDTRYLNSGMNTFIPGYDSVDINDLEITLGVKRDDKYYLSNQTYLFTNGVPTLYKRIEKIVDDSVVFEYSDLVKTDLFIPPDTRLLRGWSFIEGVDSTDSQGIIRIRHNGETQEFLFDFHDREDVVNLFGDTRYLNSGMNTFFPDYYEVDINDLEITLGVKHDDKYYLSSESINLR